MEQLFSEKMMESRIIKNKITSESKPFSKTTSESTIQQSNNLQGSLIKTSLYLPSNAEDQQLKNQNLDTSQLFQTLPDFQWKNYLGENTTKYQQYKKKKEVQLNLNNIASTESEVKLMQQSSYGVFIKHNYIPYIQMQTNKANEHLETISSDIQQSTFRAFTSNFPQIKQQMKKQKKIELLLSSSMKKRPQKLIPNSRKKITEDIIQITPVSQQTALREQYKNRPSQVFQKSYWEYVKLNEYMQYIPENLQDDNEETLMMKYFNLDFRNQKLDTRELQQHRNKKKFLFFQMLIKEVIQDIQEKIMQKTIQSKDYKEKEGAIMLNSNFITELSKLSNCLKRTITELNSLQPMSFSTNEANRTQIDKLLSTIVIFLQKQKLPTLCLSLYVVKLQAKLNFYSKDHIKAIMLFRDCKAQAEKYIATLDVNNFLLKCYKGLGKCFQEYNKYSEALHYLFRALQLAWSIFDVDQELQAYELISRQYFYKGELMLSNFYHLKMAYGEAEEKKSSIRQLGVARIKNREKKLLDPQFQVQRRMQIWKYINEEDVLQISSDEEEKFEMPIQLKKRIDINDANINKIVNQASTDKNKDNNKQRLQQISSYMLLELLKRKIGIVKRRKNENYLKALLGPKMASHQIKGNRNEAIRLTHLSPNRFLMNYHKLKPEITNLKNYNIDEYMHGQLDQDVIKKINSLFLKFKDNLQFAVYKFENIIKKGKQLEIFEKLEKSQQAKQLLMNAQKQHQVNQNQQKTIILN